MNSVTIKIQRKTSYVFDFAHYSVRWGDKHQHLKGLDTIGRWLWHSLDLPDEDGEYELFVSLPVIIPTYAVVFKGDNDEAEG